ncbi:molybdenum cofactor guanylyltransferase MobA [Ostreibacterium oceani]|uniref:Molybdenum cofactor guanylyltransferase n=1 Tax=Ostreibacterium oceani TaxID=2654998 RepID=A0A6N7EVW7_9GAMM|nr:molybdenum cofactor guanylyltransferase MobA [Ostreibacterium oceani]MPV85569.1 molybdenum cofactor guanylyltransferase [Ostreibacterium oceani]
MTGQAIDQTIDQATHLLNKHPFRNRPNTATQYNEQRTMNPKKTIIDGLLGVVLCGGRATRMQGLDKGLVLFKERPLASYGIHALANCQRVIVNANRNMDVYKETFNLPVIPDDNQAFDGPLAGLLAAMRFAHAQNLTWVISVPCDSPFISSDYVSTMWQATAAHPQRIFIANDGYNQPVFTLISTDLIDELAHFLTGDHKKILKFYQAIGYQTVSFNTSTAFINLNSLTDLDAQSAQ